MNKKCETCIKRKTMYCPNSIKCMATDDKPYYQNRIMLLEENQGLKKQLEKKQNPLQGVFAQVNDDMLLRNCGAMQSEIDKYESQQKEFIKWLENGIEKVKNTEFFDERIQKAGLIAYNRCLQKYKEIIGEVKNDL